jgi:hypothetical protein
MIEGIYFFIFFEAPFYLLANWCKDWMLWLMERHSVVPFRKHAPEIDSLVMMYIPNLALPFKSRRWRRGEYTDKQGVEDSIIVLSLGTN